METNDTCLYIHTRKTDGRIFYVGIGNKNRPYSTGDRNDRWNKIVKKHKRDVTILKTNMSWEEACDLEIKMIAFYGRLKPSKNNANYGCLVNMTDGGEGANGTIRSEELKQKQRDLMTGKNNPNYGISNYDRWVEKYGVEYANKRQKESIIKVSQSLKGKMSGEKHPASKKVICSITNKIYGCAKYASIDLGINYVTLLSYLKGRNPNKTSLKYL
jgi:hypothetical protein